MSGVRRHPLVWEGEGRLLHKDLERKGAGHDWSGVDQRFFFSKSRMGRWWCITSVAWSLLMGSQVHEAVILGDALRVLLTTANALVDRGEQHPGLEKELTLPRRRGGFQSPKFPGGVDGQSPRGRPLSRYSKLTVGHWNFCVWVTTTRPGNEVPSQRAYLDHHIPSGGKTKFITSLFYQAIYFFFLESHYYYIF